MKKLEKLKQEALRTFRARVDPSMTLDELYDIKYHVLEIFKLRDDGLTIKTVEVDGNEFEVRDYLNKILKEEIDNYELSREGIEKPRI